MNRRVRGLVVAALVLATSAAAFTIRRSVASSPPTVPAATLNWDGMMRHGRQLPTMRSPFALLYVLPSCPHCAAVVQRFVLEARKRGVRGLVVAGAGSGDVREYQLRLGLTEEIAVDSARLFARSAGIQWVPSLILFSPLGAARVLPVPAPGVVGRYLSSLE